MVRCPLIASFQQLREVLFGCIPVIPACSWVAISTWTPRQGAQRRSRRGRTGFMQESIHEVLAIVTIFCEIQSKRLISGRTDGVHDFRSYTPPS